MNEEELEIKETEKSKKRFDELCLWLNSCEIEYRIENWESGEGRDIIVNPTTPNECIISFYDSGYIKLNYLADEDG